MEKVEENGVNNGADNNSNTSTTPATITIKGILGLLMESTDDKDQKRVISLGMGDPTAYSCFHTPHVAQDSVLQSLQSHNFNGYAPTVGLIQTRR